MNTEPPNDDQSQRTPMEFEYLPPEPARPPRRHNRASSVMAMTAMLAGVGFGFCGGMSSSLWRHDPRREKSAADHEALRLAQEKRDRKARRKAELAQREKGGRGAD